MASALDWRARWPLLAALALYLTAGLFQLDLPGLQYDEAFDAWVAVQVLQRTSPTCVLSIQLGPWSLPIMLLDYEGPTNIYTSLIGLSLLGISVEALRITQLAIGTLTISLLWTLTRQWFDRSTATIAVLLCATAPAYVFWSRSGANWMLPQLPIALGFLLARERALQSQRQSWRFLAGLLFGVGTTSKILFVWLAAPLVLISAWRRLEGRWYAPKPEGVPSSAPPKASSLPWGVLGLLLGLAPLIFYNLDGAPTLQRLSSNALTTELHGHQNLAVFDNLVSQLNSFARMMGGSIVPIAAPEGIPIGVPLLALGWFAPCFSLLSGARAPRDRTNFPNPTNPRAFLLATMATVLPLSTFSPTRIGATYLFLIVPLAWLLIAVALRDVGSLLGRQLARPKAPGHTGRSLTSLLVCGLLLHNVIGTARIQQFFAATGGRGLWSASIYDLAARLEGLGRPVVAMDWGFARNIAFLTEGRVQPEEKFEYAPKPSAKFFDTCLALLDDPTRLYLFHVEHHTAFKGVLPVLQAAAAQRNLSLHLLATSPERDGLANSLLYEARHHP